MYVITSGFSLQSLTICKDYFNTSVHVQLEQLIPPAIAICVNHTIDNDRPIRDLFVDETTIINSRVRLFDAIIDKDTNGSLS